jgi:flavin-dependent dehydrogenase
MTEEVDVLIVGGGPAGTAAAIESAKAGLRVALLERSRYEEVRVGETLPPEARIQLEELGVWDTFLRDGHIASPGNVSVWGSPVPGENDFLFNPYGCGWHLDRRLMDEMLALRAEALGVSLCRETRVVSCVRVPAGCWIIGAMRKGVRHEFRAKYVIDATGRRSLLATQQGIKRNVYDRLVGIIRFYTSKAEAELLDDRTFVEAAEPGWWYSATLPGGSLVVAFMTDADLLPGGRDVTDYWQGQLQKSVFTQGRVSSYSPQNPVRIVSASSQTLSRVAGAGWLAVGDAAAAFDPLSSSGILNALESGVRAARAIIDTDGRVERADQSYEQWMDGLVATFLRYRASYYGMERRWPDSPFWNRRLTGSASYIEGKTPRSVGRR